MHQRGDMQSGRKKTQVSYFKYNFISFLLVYILDNNASNRFRMSLEMKQKNTTVLVSMH